MVDDADTTDDPFDDVEPDPDAVLEGFGIDEPEDLLEQADDSPETATPPRNHDPTKDPVIDADDCIASELFDDLQAVARTLESSKTVTKEPQAERSSDSGIQLDFSAIDASDESSEASPVASDSVKAPSLELLGPTPTPVRIANDAFGNVG